MKIFTFDAAIIENDSQFNEYMKKVSLYRKGKIERLKHRRDKMLSLAASLAIDAGLNEYGLYEKDMAYAKNKYGKPYFIDHPEIHFSVSHSGTMAAAAFSEREIGCDIEKMRKVDIKIAERFFCTEEVQYIKSCPDPEEAFLRHWTLKESFLKALGLGISIPLDSFRIDIADGMVCVLQSINDHEYTFFEKACGDYYIAVCETKGTAIL